MHHEDKAGRILMLDLPQDGGAVIQQLTGDHNEIIILDPAALSWLKCRLADELK